jgi:hypothetical protein
MKKNYPVTFALIASLSLFIFSCGPNDDGGGMDSKNSGKEGAVDSTRIPKPDSMHSSISVPRSTKERVEVPHL